MRLTTQILFFTILAMVPANCQTPGPGTDPPKIHGQTLNGKPIELPEAAAGKVAVLILGFSRQGGQGTGGWQQHLSRDFAGDPHFTSYTVAVLEGAPRLLRGMIKSGIRSGTPVARRDHVVTTVSGEEAWKKFAGVSDENVPYLVLLDDTGHVRWSAHGLFGPQQYDALKMRVKDVESGAKGSQ